MGKKKDRRPPIETRTRKLRRLVTVRENRCQFSGCRKWFETHNAYARYCPQPAQCRMRAHREALKPT